MSPVPAEHHTLVELLKSRTEHNPQGVAIRFLADGENESDSVTYAQLDRKARAVAEALRENAEIGDRVLLCYAPGIEFICGFLGCLYARMIAVPIYPPGNERGMGRLKSVLNDCKSQLILSDSKALKRLSASNEMNGQHWIDTEALGRGECSFVLDSKPSPDEIAFLQYTSGSTGSPKGVMVSHGNIMQNLRMLGDAVRADTQTASVSWLPVYHDMGLIAGVLLPLYAGYPGILFPPVSFIEKPVRWLRAIAKYQASFITAPNFAYDLLLRKVSDEEISGLDLSCLNVVANAAEPVRAETLFRFQDRFSRAGLKPNVLLPSYGLAEATLIVSGKMEVGAAPKILKVAREALDEGRVERLEWGEPKALVGCGQICIGQTVAIVDPETKKECLAGRVGEIWVAGRHIAQGYWSRARQTEEDFHARLPAYPGKTFLRTGDLGFIDEGDLYITGRLKDMLILFGRNFYPQDIEETVEKSSLAIRPGSCVAFAVEGERGDEACVVAEISRTALKEDLEKISQTILRSVGLSHELSLSRIHLLKPGGLPKTTSGKQQRKLTAQLMKKGELPTVYCWPSAQVAAIEEKKVNSPTSKVSDLVAWLREYGETRINSRLMDERRTIPPYVVLDFGNQGLMGMLVPSEYGGLGLSYSDFSTVLQQIAAIDLSLAIFVGLNNGLGIHPILHFGTQATKQRWLPTLAAGRQLAAFAVTERQAGSNPMALQSSARMQNGSFLLDGEKIWIGNASWAGVISVFVKEQSQDGSIGGVSGFVVESTMKGLRHGPESMTMGVRPMVQNSFTMDQVAVSGENRLGNSGEGMTVASHTMNFARYGLAVLCLGAMKRCLQWMMEYADGRSVSTGRLLENPVTLSRMDWIVQSVESLEILTGRIAEDLQAGREVPQEAYLACKILAPEMLGQAADWAMQLLGGRGYMETNLVAQLYRDARLIRIFEGPTETLEMHLGSLVANKPQSLQTWFKTPSGNGIWQKFASEETAGMKEMGGGANDPSHKVWLHSMMGKLGAWRLLQALSPNSSWLSDECQVVREKIRAQSKRFGSLQSESLRQKTDLYFSQIGNVRQSLPGEETGMDDWMTRSKRQVPTPLAPPVFTPKPPTPQSPAVQVDPVVVDKKPEVADQVREKLITWFAKAAQITVDKVEVNKPLVSYGLDSLMAYELGCQIEETYDLHVPSNLLWDYPTLNAVTDYLVKALRKKAA